MTALSRPLTAAVLTLPLLAGCGTRADDGGSAPSPTTAREVTVLAAASLTETFTQLADTTAAEETFSFGSSTTLAEQAGNGAPGDVLATADRSSMDLAVRNGAVAAEPVQFASNTLVLVVPAANPAGISGVADLPGTDWVRCADEVPCGRLARTLLADVPVGSPVSLEVDVKAVLAKVVSGGADAGLVYATDAAAAGDAVRTFAVPGADTEPNTYWVAPLAQGDRQAAEAFIGALRGPAGTELLERAGFGGTGQ